CVCVEMESFALFHNARILGKHAACLLTISDSLVSDVHASAQERQTSFANMMEVALEAAVRED
ncbi:MAG: purine nucleoside phosphorylase DeoD-type, partial [Merdibacter sp.]